MTLHDVQMTILARIEDLGCLRGSQIKQKIKDSLSDLHPQDSQDLKIQSLYDAYPGTC